jgi:hypothetical protein
MARSLTDPRLFRRAFALYWFPDTVSLFAPAAAAVLPSGGTARGAVTETRGVRCRLTATAVQALTRLFGQQVTVGRDWLLLLPYGARVVPGWSVEGKGRAFTVIAVTAYATDQLTVAALLREQTVVG